MSLRAPPGVWTQGPWGLGLALLAGVMFSIWLFPGQFYRGDHPYWHVQNEDVAVYVSGFNAFFREPWHWPLLKITSLNWPEGTLATFVDIIPLYAGVLKLFLPPEWFPFNPFGVWVLICLILQALGTWWVLKEAEASGWPLLLALTLLLLTFPAWLSRQGHISLLSHWVLIFAFALTLRSRRTETLAVRGWIALVVVTFFINLYLDAMAFAIFAADCFRSLRRGDVRRASGATIAVIFILGPLIYITMCPFPGETGAPEIGFGTYSLNLLSPFSGGRWLDLPSASPEQQFEGFNYLGLGGGCLILLAASTALGKGSCSVAPFWELRAVLLLLTVYAISNQIYWGTTLLWRFDLPEWSRMLTGQFRASGRFFWPVGYALLIFSILRLSHVLKPGCLHGVLALALILQTADLWPRLSKVRRLEYGSANSVINFSEWDARMPKDVEAILFYPKFKCGKKTGILETILPVMRYASERGFKFNTGYIARHNPECGREREQIAASDYKKTVYVFVTQEYEPEGWMQFFLANWNIRCRPVNFATLCQQEVSPDWTGE